MPSLHTVPVNFKQEDILVLVLDILLTVMYDNYYAVS